jgi:hypothetical protein
MAKSISIPTTATLLRFGINLEKLPEGFEIWTLDFPYGEAVKAYQEKVAKRVKDKVNSEFIGIPYRQLNNALMAVCPTLTHGFEVAGKNQPFRALAVGVPFTPAQLPTLENIQHIVRAWALWWTNRPYILQYIPANEQKTMQAELIQAINTLPLGWNWKRVSVDQLLRSFNPNEPLNYTVWSSLLATLLHGQTSIIFGKRIQWRKVQDSDSSKLSIVGFIGQRPIWTSYRINEYRMKKSGEGFFAYKIDFNLQTSAGKDKPWMFISLHAQRYGHEAFTKDNSPRRVSVLVGANRARLDDFPVDSTLVKLQITGGINNPEWDDSLPELLDYIRVVTTLEQPLNIFTNPQSYWRPIGADTDYNKDEYYLVHAEGYGYGEDSEGHELEAGFSMTESAAVFESILTEHLTFLEPDKQLIPDPTSSPSGKQLPFAMRDYSVWANKPSMKPKEWGTLGERRQEQHERYLQQRGEYQVIIEETIQRALREEKMLILILWHNESTRDGICLALREAFLLNPNNNFPLNVMIIDRHVDRSLLNALDTSNQRYAKAHHELMRKWQEFLQQQQLPAPLNYFAIVEMLNDSWGVKGATREACVKENITSQMVRTIRMKADKNGNLIYLGGRGNHEHRSNSVAREITLRHMGALYGDPQEIYQMAGIKDELEIVAFHLERTQTNILYPIATKLATDGAVEILLPDQEDWLLYNRAAPQLGKIFAAAWKNTIYKGKRKIKEDKREESGLWYDKVKLSRFILDVLKSLKKPTIALIEADNWRQWDRWPQLRNPDFSKNWNVLNFTPHDRTYQRNDTQFNNLLAVIRIRVGNETPQYLTDTHRDFTRLTGLLDISVDGLMHYFSIGRLPVTAKAQKNPKISRATMIEGIGSGVAYKHPQVVEFVPFFVREDYQNLEGLKQLCRVPHYLRISPAWPHGNLIYPYPLHLARQLIKDQLCILAMED